METGVWCSPGLVCSAPPFALRHLTYATSCRTSGLQSKRTGTAISAFSGPHSRTRPQTFDTLHGLSHAPVDDTWPPLIVHSRQEGCVHARGISLSRLMLYGEASLHHALTQYVAHFHQERNHQGKGNVRLLPTVNQDAKRV